MDAIETLARPLAGTSPDLPLDDLEPLRPVVGDAVVVGVGEATRFAHEVFDVRVRVLRFLVERLGFGMLAIETGPDVAERLDTWIHGGPGDPAAILDDAWVVWRTEEFLALLHRLRAHNRDGGDVRLAGIDPEDRSSYEPSGGADRIAAVHTRTGRRVVYWGGTGHTAVHRPEPGFPPFVFPRTEGTYLRVRLGDGYVSVGVTFGRGYAGRAIAPPSPELAESALSELAEESGASGSGGAVLLDLTRPAPEAAAAWLDTPTRARVIGPSYDPSRDVEYSIAGTPLRVLFDAVLHVPEVGSVTPLPDPAAARAAGPGSR